MSCQSRVSLSLDPEPIPYVTWACRAGVPPLPPITSVKGLGPAYRDYTWMYDQNFVIRSYSFSNLDMVRHCSP